MWEEVGALMEAPEYGEDLFGRVHVHRYVRPWRGYLMCDYHDVCGALSTVEGLELTEEQETAVYAEVRAEYAGKPR